MLTRHARIQSLCLYILANTCGTIAFIAILALMSAFIISIIKN